MCQSRPLPSDTEGSRGRSARAPLPQHNAARRGPPKGAHLTRSACWSPPRRWRRWPRWARCCPPRPAEGASGSPRPARWRTSRTCGSTTTRRSATHTHTRTSARRSRPPAKPAPPRPATQPAPCCWVAGPAGRFRKGARGREKPQ